MLDPVGCRLIAHICEIGPVLHREIDDGNSPGPGRRQGTAGGRYRAPNAGYVDAGPVEHAALGAEIILHVDDEDRRARKIDRQCFGPRANGDDLLFPAHPHSPIGSVVPLLLDRGRS